MNAELLTGFFLAMLAIVNPFDEVRVWLRAVSQHGPAVRRRPAILVTATAFGSCCSPSWADATPWSSSGSTWPPSASAAAS